MRLTHLVCALSFFASTLYLRALEAERLFYLSGGEVCVGCIYKPKGSGPFPAVVFNQNVAKPLPAEGELDPFPDLAKFYTSHQFILFSPGRRKMKDVSEDLKASGKRQEERGLQFHQMQCETIFSAIETLKAQADVDPEEIFITGFGQGAVDTLLLAEKELDVRALVAFSPNVTENLILQNAVRESVRNTRTPVFLLQTQGDPGLAMLDPIVLLLQEKGYPHVSKIYSTGKKASHSFAINSSDMWGNEVLSFFRAASNKTAIKNKAPRLDKQRGGVLTSTIKPTNP